MPTVNAARAKRIHDPIYITSRVEKKFPPVFSVCTMSHSR